MRWISIAVLGVLGCGDDGGAVPDGAGTDDATGQTDASADARPPNTRHRGLVQAIVIGNGTSTAAAGFIAVDASAPGCTWTYAGACALAVCGADAGLSTVSAGSITFTGGDAPVTLVPDAMGAYAQMSAPTISPGTSVSVAAAGADVGAFAKGPLVMPTQLAVTAPVANQPIDRAQDLAIAWTAAPGDVYVNLSQVLLGNPYPDTYQHTIRCFAPATSGSMTIPASLLGQLASGMNANLAIAAAATETFDVGELTIDFRVAAVDEVRVLPVP